VSTSCGSYGWVQIDCSPQYVADELGSLGTLQTMFLLRTSPSVSMVCSWFPERALQVVACRCGNKTF